MTLASTELDPERARAYQRDGFVLLPGLIPADLLATWQDEADRLVSDRPLFEARGALLKGDPRTDRLDPVIDVSPVFHAATTHPVVTGIVEALLGAPVQLFKDKFIAKPAGAPGYDAHQDLPYWPGFDLDGDALVTVIAFLDPADAGNGALECSAGQHGAWLTPPGVVADPDESVLGTFQTLSCRAGDVVLLHSLTPHRSGPNRSDRSRRTLLLTYTTDPTPELWARYQSSRRAQDVTS